MSADLTPQIDLDEIAKRPAYRDGVGGEDCPIVELSPFERDALVSLARQAQGWQPIETAPKDGTRVLANGPHGLLRCVHWERTIFGPTWMTDDNSVAHPEHWQPLPAPPSPEDR